tara:strand:- start:41 stop:1618 length:1578 start_codon:yes stop_codon:yes gene_type:complete
MSSKNRNIANLGTGFVNISDTGTEGTKVAAGTTAQRGTSIGQFRFNSTTGKFEGRNATGFVSIQSAPVVTAVDDTEIDSASGGNQTLVITGENFESGDVAKFVGNDGTEITASTTTIDSATQITAIIPKASFVNSKEPYDIKIVSATGAQGILADQINVDNAPQWQTAAGSLGTFNHTARTGLNMSTSATDPDGSTVSYAIQSGSIPAGLSLNTSTGAITGDATAVGSHTTSSFTLRATSGGKTADRAFSITINAPQTTKTTYDFVSAAMQTFSIPAGTTSVDFAMWGAGSGLSGSAMEGTGGFGSGTIDTTGLSNLYLVVGQSGFGAGGRQAGGGLSGIFSANSVTQGNAIAICGGGGGSSETGAGGGGGGGLNQSGLSGTAGRQGSGAGGASTSGGGSGASSTGGSPGQSGSALQGGGAPGDTSWTTRAYYGGGIPYRAPHGHPGGCGGAGYYGGGGGSDYYGTGGGGGSGYADTSLVSNIVAIQGNTDSFNQPTNSSHPDWSGEISRGTSAGHGRIVIEYTI